MAIRISRPKSGFVNVQPAQSYTSTVAKYQEEFRQAVVNEENSNIQQWVNAFEIGDLGFKDLISNLKDTQGNYEKSSVRYATLDELILSTRTTNIQMIDRAGSISDLEKFGKDGLTLQEELTMAQNRIDRVRKAGAQKYAPDVYEDALIGLANVQSDISKESEGRGSRQREAEATELLLMEQRIKAEYADPTDPSSGVEADSALSSIYNQLLTNYKDELSLTEQIRLEDEFRNTATRSAQRDAQQGFDVLVSTTDTEGNTIRQTQFVMAEDLGNIGDSNLVTRQNEQGTGWDIVDTLTGEKVEENLISKEIAEQKIAELPKSVTIKGANGQFLTGTSDPSTGKIEFVDRPIEEVLREPEVQRAAQLRGSERLGIDIAGRTREALTRQEVFGGRPDIDITPVGGVRVGKGTQLFSGIQERAQRRAVESGAPLTAPGAVGVPSSEDIRRDIERQRNLALASAERSQFDLSPTARGVVGAGGGLEIDPTTGLIKGGGGRPSFYQPPRSRNIFQTIGRGISNVGRLLFGQR